MKKIILLIFVLLFSSMSIACESNRYNIFYLPLEIDFYIPPTREYIMKHGIKFEIDSCLLHDLFKDTDSQRGVDPQQEDYTGLRIMIVNNEEQNELFITTDKVVFSLSKKKRYVVDEKTVDKILKELADFIKAKDLD